MQTVKGNTKVKGKRKQRLRKLTQLSSIFPGSWNQDCLGPRKNSPDQCPPSVGGGSRGVLSTAENRAFWSTLY